MRAMTVGGILTLCYAASIAAQRVPSTTGVRPIASVKQLHDVRRRWRVPVIRLPSHARRVTGRTAIADDRWALPDNRQCVSE